MGIIAYELTSEDQKRLLDHFPAKYPTVRANHVTISGDYTGTELPPPARIEIIGYADDGNGVEALVVTANGEAFREVDGRRYHITMSFDHTKLAPAEFEIEGDPAGRQARPYGGVHSNGLIAVRGFQKASVPFSIEAPARYYEGHKPVRGARFSEPEIK